MEPIIPKPPPPPPPPLPKPKEESMRQLFEEKSPTPQPSDPKRLYSPETKAVAADLKAKMEPAVPPGAGASVLVAANGERAQHLGFGQTSVEGGQPVDKNTAAIIGSGAKMFTGILSKVLEQKGILSLQTKLSELMEDFSIFTDPEAARDITLEMLLSHTSGLQYHAEIGNNAREGMNWDQILEQMGEEVKNNPKKAIGFTNVPGDGVYAYSNQISLAGIFIEKAYKKATGQSCTYAEILNKELLTPLSMTRTGYKQPDGKALRVYRNDNNNPRSEDGDLRDPVMHPVGGLWSTAADMEKLAEAFRTAFKTREGLKGADGKVLLSPEALEDLLRPRGLSGVASLGIDRVGSFFGKGGEILTYDFKFCFDRETDSYIVSFCNFNNSPEFRGYIEQGHQVPGYIDHVIPTIDRIHGTTPTAAEPAESAQGLPLEKCDRFYYGGFGIVGIKSDAPGWINWNGEVLPVKETGKNRFVITGTEHKGKAVIFNTGYKGNPYLFIEERPKIEKVIIPIAFKAVSPADKARFEEIEALKREKDFSAAEVAAAQGTYASTMGAEGMPPITLKIEGGAIKVSSQERLDDKGKPLEIPMTVAKSVRDQSGNLSELWLVGSFMRVPLFQLKLIKQPQWELKVVDFTSKDEVDTLKILN